MIVYYGFQIKMLSRAVCLTRSRVYFSSYRMPVNFLNYLEKYTQEHNPRKSPSIVENYKSLKEKLSECEELQTFVSNSEDKELREIAELDIEDVYRDIEQIVDSVRDELGWLSVTISTFFCQVSLLSSRAMMSLMIIVTAACLSAQREVRRRERHAGGCSWCWRTGGFSLRRGDLSLLHQLLPEPRL